MPLVSLPGNLCSDCMAEVVVVGREMEEGEGRKGKREGGRRREEQNFLLSCLLAFLSTWNV